MSIWYALCDALPIEMLQWDFMKNAFLAILLMAPLFGLLTNWISRRAEYRADAQAVKEGCGDALVDGLKKLARENLSDLSPSPLLVKLQYSHPPLSQRIKAIEKLQAEKE